MRIARYRPSRGPPTERLSRRPVPLSCPSPNRPRRCPGYTGSGSGAHVGSGSGSSVGSRRARLGRAPVVGRLRRPGRIRVRLVGRRPARPSVSSGPAHPWACPSVPAPAVGLRSVGRFRHPGWIGLRRVGTARQSARGAGMRRRWRRTGGRSPGRSRPCSPCNRPPGAARCRGSAPRSPRWSHRPESRVQAHVVAADDAVVQRRPRCAVRRCRTSTSRPARAVLRQVQEEAEVGPGPGRTSSRRAQPAASAWARRPATMIATCCEVPLRPLRSIATDFNTW